MPGADVFDYYVRVLLVPLAVVSIPARVSTSYDAIRQQLSFLMFEFNDDLEPKVVRVQTVMASHEVGFKVLGVLLNAARVKSLAMSGIVFFLGSGDGSSTNAPNNTLHGFTY